MISSLPSALTLTEIGRRLGEPPHRIRYVIRSRGLRPSKRAGHCGLFSESDVDFIGRELRRIDLGRGDFS